MANVVKKRNWAFVLYPESAPVNWREILTETGLQCCVSPLHDKDFDEGGNSEGLKKPHYHVILHYSGPTSFNVVKKLTDSLCQPRPIPLEQVKGYYRYLTHKDNPEKYQYDENDITYINGFSLVDFCELSRSEILSIKKTIHNLIRENNFVEYAALMDFLADNLLWTEYEVASNHTLFFDRLLTSRRHSIDTSSNLSIDSVTGEVID